MKNFFLLFSVPNLLTLLNLTFGVTGIICATHGRPDYALYCMLGSGVSDFLDGWAARFFRQQQAIGKDLDSLSDIVSFGCLPGILIFEHLNHAGFSFMQCLPAFILPAFSALRLAKFNHDSRQSSFFYGVPTPITGLFWASWFYPPVFSFMNQPLWIYAALMITSVLLLMDIPMLSFKIKKFFSKENILLFLFLISCLLLVMIFQWKAMIYIYVVYVICGLIFWIFMSE